MALATKKLAGVLGVALVVLLVCVFVGRNSPASSSWQGDPLRRHQLSVDAAGEGANAEPVVVESEQDTAAAGGGGTGQQPGAQPGAEPFFHLIPPASSTSPKPQQSQSSQVSLAAPGGGHNPSPPPLVPISTLATQERTPLPLPPPPPPFKFSRDLFVRAVYFDSRPRDGHRNTSVFLVVCMRNITAHDLIVGCQVDGVSAEHFTVKLIGETPLWRAFYDYIDHEEALVHCYDLPARNGSVAHIAYRKNRATQEVSLAASERPLFVPAPRITPTSREGLRYNMTVVSCAKVFNHPPWLKEWLTYQRTLGVDHVHLDAEDSFRKTGGTNQPYIKELVSEGFLSIDIWTQYLSGREIWYHNQGLIYEDCPYRFRGTYDYIVMMDTDDFWTPRIPTEKKIHFYINRHCRGARIGSCKFRWVEYYPDSYGINKSISLADGNVTKALNSYTHYNQGNPKSLHRTTVLIDTATHYAYTMMPGYRIISVPVTEAYVAHVRLYKKAGDGLVRGLPSTCSEHVLSKMVLLVSLVFVFTCLYVCT